MTRFGIGLATVRGRSMEPMLRDGDRLLFLRGLAPRPGRLALVRLPRDADGAPRPLAIKRISGTDPADPTLLWVEADNQRATGVVDSWTLGHGLARADVQAVVLFRVPTKPIIGMPSPWPTLRRARERLRRR